MLTVTENQIPDSTEQHAYLYKNQIHLSYILLYRYSGMIPASRDIARFHHRHLDTLCIPWRLSYSSSPPIPVCICKIRPFCCSFRCWRNYMYRFPRSFYRIWYRNILKWKQNTQYIYIYPFVTAISKYTTFTVLPMSNDINMLLVQFQQEQIIYIVVKLTSDPVSINFNLSYTSYLNFSPIGGRI